MEKKLTLGAMMGREESIEWPILSQNRELATKLLIKCEIVEPLGDWDCES